MAAVGKHCMTVILIARHRGAPTTSRNGISPLIPILPRTSHSNHTMNLSYHTYFIYSRPHIYQPINLIRNNTLYLVGHYLPLLERLVVHTNHGFLNHCHSCFKMIKYRNHDLSLSLFIKDLPQSTSSEARPLHLEVEDHRTTHSTSLTFSSTLLSGIRITFRCDHSQQ